ncbi:RagB/SusD family nutrient uptake outer membrane protein [Niabella beijingensis]|uniref:RagB/SusD family nutrient uptake outer membrane protein n=1 Tax=Niabella beijingensis TaxID=2872700 RepID=UPI001CBCE5B3|nr:RagB/SusD family nutrient uptake outer membrane protein [Niabella beijingensis]MBZ4187563.1 RagB/SusD family nutrient uptake outer membrane protein [Niabella beijingensis]
MRNKLLITILIVSVVTSCKKYLDVVPDNIATIDHAFNMRQQAEKFLFTCYSYIPRQSIMSGSANENPALGGGDELWFHEFYIPSSWNIARGFQNVVNPYDNFWQGSGGGKDLYQGISDCNIFLENIVNTPDIDPGEKNRWIAEVKFLKAYYHFYLTRMYGPVPIKRVNLPINASPDMVKVYRDPVDSCFNYVVELIDEAVPDLPETILNEVAELGRITKPIALAIKAEVLVTAASPLFNGNADFANFKDNRGITLFNTTYDPRKWERASEACKDAIDACHAAGNKLYYYSQSNKQYEIPDTLRTQMNIRNAVNEKWNAEIIWGNTNSMVDNLQIQATPRGLDPSKRASQSTLGNCGVPLKMVSKFYTKNGVPIDEDKTWDYSGRFSLIQGAAASRNYLVPEYTTSKMNYDREPRYYADLGFDGGVWYGQGKFTTADMWYVSSKKGDPAANIANGSFNSTGVWPKKYVNYVNVIQDNTYSRENYPWPVMRLANLYLLYAEALNETAGPSPEVYSYLDQLRERAGLQGVVASWAAFSYNPTKPATKEGLREIIHRERTIELMFEGQRFWDLRRWKTALQELNQPVTGWDIEQKTPEGYYRERLLYQQTFSLKEYLWPVREVEIFANKNTVQNPGW